MCLILKEPYDNSKGILVFTHKERDYVDSRILVVAETIARVREKYVIGMHWGHYDPSVGDLPNVDFHLAGRGTILFREGVKARHIQLCSRNFTPACFRKMGIPKYWDIINISRPLKLKNLDEFLATIRRIYDKGHHLKVLLICPCPFLMDDEGWYTELYEDYVRMFSREEREDFTLLLLRGDGYPFPLSQSTLAYFYNASKVFALFSDVEGESRVIAEALLCGIPVVVKKHLRGGGRDYLTEENSGQFSTLDEACELLIEFSGNDEKYLFDTELLQKSLSETYTVATLEREITTLFAELGLVFKGPLNVRRLDRRLPSHELTLPADLRREITNDLNSHLSTMLYLNSLLGKETNIHHRSRLACWLFKEKVCAHIQNIRLLIGRWKGQIVAKLANVRAHIAGVKS